MKTFREYIKEKYSDRARDNSNNPIDLVVYDILNDKTFPDQENDGLMVRSYIRDRQPVGMTKKQIEGNREMVETFEELWILYKADAGQYPTRNKAG